MKQFSPAKETGLNSSNSSYSPFHKPLPETPPSKNILERRSSKELDSSNFDGAKPSPIVTNTRSATFDMSYLTSNTSQQPNRRSTYLSNQSSKAIPPESMDTRVHKGVNYTSNVSKTTLSSMDQKPQQPFNIPFSWERSSSSGIQTDASFESPDKSGLLLDPDDSPPVIPPRQPFLSSTPLPDQTDGLRDQSSNYLKNELESRSQWVPEKARKISSQTPNTKVGKFNLLCLSPCMWFASSVEIFLEIRQTIFNANRLEVSCYLPYNLFNFTSLIRLQNFTNSLLKKKRIHEELWKSDNSELRRLTCFHYSIELISWIFIIPNRSQNFSLYDKWYWLEGHATKVPIWPFFRSQGVSCEPETRSRATRENFWPTE